MAINKKIESIQAGTDEGINIRVNQLETDSKNSNLDETAKDKMDKEMGSNKVSWTAHTSGAYWQQRLSVALQRGNAKMVHRRGARDSTEDTA